MEMLAGDFQARPEDVFGRRGRTAIDAADLKMLEELSLKAERAQPKPTQANPLYSNFGRRPDSAGTATGLSTGGAESSGGSPSRVTLSSPSSSVGKSRGRPRKVPVKRRRADTPETEDEEWLEQSSDTEVQL